MGIHIQTTDPKPTKQHTQLLAGGQQPFHFHEDLEAAWGGGFTCEDRRACAPPSAGFTSEAPTFYVV
jgi:hypothetical protein